MAIDFPNSPTTGQVFTSGNLSWTYDGSKWNLSGTSTSAFAPIGTIIAYAGSILPNGWIHCDGASYNRTTYEDLFGVIGTAFGEGSNPGTTFNVPNFGSSTAEYIIRTYDEAVTLTTSDSLIAVPVGSMQLFAMNTVPTGWVRANGMSVGRTAYADLFAAIGTTYGSGDGSTTFNIPNITDSGVGSPAYYIKAILSGDVEPSTVAHAASHEEGGTDVVTVTLNQIPSYRSNRNYIINGGFDIWQRGTSISSAGYIADRFFHDNATTVDRQTDVPANAGFKYSVRHVASSQVFPSIRQRVESLNATNLAGKYVTMSFWAKSGTTTAGTGRMYVNFNYPNAADNYSTKTTIINNFDTDAWIPDAIWRFYSFTFLAPSQVVNGLECEIVRHNSATTTFVTGVQLEVGSVATPFEFEHYETTLRKCQRYYFIAYAGNSTSGIPLLRGNSPFLGNRYYAIFSSPVAPRITNFTFPIIASGTQIHKPGVRWDTANSMSVDNIGSNNYYFAVNPGVDDGSSYYVIFLASVAIINNAEL